MGVGYTNNDKKGLTRRQFLTYALGGTGAFMGITIIGPMIPFAVDPLTRSGSTSFKAVGKTTQFNENYPVKIEFSVHQKDGWIEADNKYTAFVLKQKDGTYLAMSSICTHLGCQVNYNPGPDGKATPFTGNIWFQCPCHGSQFSLTGVQTPQSPAQRPLDVFATKVDGDQLLLGPKHQRKV